MWQVHDLRAGPLLTGPEWPETQPDSFNGQGLPEAFRHRTPAGSPVLWRGETGLSPGAGRLAQRDGATSVVEPCEWTIESGPTHAVFRTAQTVLDWSYALERTLMLDGRTLRSRTRYTNRSTTPLVHEWFAHPFFALGTDGRATIAVPTGTSMAENPGYALADNRLMFRRAFQGKDDGHLETLHLPARQPLAIEISHPRLTEVRFTTDFEPLRTVIWANGNTVSVEPFLPLRLAPGETHEWELTYTFGDPV